MKICSIFIIFYIFSTTSGDAHANSPEPIVGSIKLVEQRRLYQQAVRAYNNKDLATYQNLSRQLTDYPLHPYLVSLSLKDSLERLPYYEVDQFLEKNNGTVVGREVLAEWLKVLAEKKHWHDYRSYYDTSLRSTLLQCYNLWARIKTADKTAFNEVGALWNVKQSQPESCDPLFEEWLKQGYLSDELLWQRFQKATIAKQHGLVRHLNNLAKADKKPYFALFKSVNKQPEKIKTAKLLQKKNSYTIDIIKHGLTRLQRQQPEQSLEYFRKFESKNYLNAEFKESFLARNNRNEIRNLSLEELKNTALISTNLSDQEDIIERILLRSVREQNWPFYISWYRKVSTELQEKDKWLYWYARALNETSNGKQKQSMNVYQQLAKRRSYYGFLAADKIKQPYAMINTPLNVDDKYLLEIISIPAIARARELYFVDDIRQARREWRDGTQEISVMGVQASAKLAHNWGWHRKAIEMLGSIKAWDHLTVRFPVMHQDYINKKAKRFNYSPSLIFAIARQESAWQKDATSHAGARGLMQLIPSTAQDAARKVGVKHTQSQLYTPEHNILLGSFHMSELLENNDNNRLLAIAAYNAGQHRVNQWVGRTKGALPYDVWIETIPFLETRKYVKNVLYYSALYDYRSGNDVNLLTALERRTPL